jgi:hypothetical protein
MSVSYIVKEIGEKPIDFLEKFIKQKWVEYLHHHPILHSLVKISPLRAI